MVGRRLSLCQIWWEEGVSQADMEFPWIDTDLYAKTGTSDESPSGVVGYWFLQRGRAFWALSQFQGMPDGDMETLAYVTTFRNSDKLGMIKPGKFMENPMFVKIRSDILFHKGISAYAHSDMHEGRPLSELEYSVISTKEQMANLEAGRVMQGIQGMNLRNYIFNALAAGLIDHNEYKTLNNITPKT